MYRPPSEWPTGHRAAPRRFAQLGAASTMVAPSRARGPVVAVAVARPVVGEHAGLPRHGRQRPIPGADGLAQPVLERQHAQPPACPGNLDMPPPSTVCSTGAPARPGPRRRRRRPGSALRTIERTCIGDSRILTMRRMVDRGARSTPSCDEAAPRDDEAANPRGWSLSGAPGGAWRASGLESHSRARASSARAKNASRAAFEATTGGSGEIRTHGPLRADGFQDRCNRPLCHASWSRGRDCSDRACVSPACGPAGRAPG